MLKEAVKAELVRLEKRIKELKEKRRNLPLEKLYVNRNQSRYKWFINDGKSTSYFPKKNKEHAVRIVKGMLMDAELDDLENEREAVYQYLQHHREVSKREKFLTDERYFSLFSEETPSGSDMITKWLSEEYRKSTKYPEQQSYKSVSGNVLRSKSEMMIDILLSHYQIPFRYECALSNAEGDIYPDFTIMHPLTGKIFYWEHLGLIENENYLNSVIFKIRVFAEHKIYPGINLILTSETKSQPLNTEIIDKIIHTNFF